MLEPTPPTFLFLSVAAECPANSLPNKKQSQCHGRGGDSLRVFPMNRRVLTNGARPNLLIDVTDLSPCGNTARQVGERARRLRSRIAQRLNVRNEERFSFRWPE
jgi:hypothetical protein